MSKKQLFFYALVVATISGLFLFRRYRGQRAEPVQPSTNNSVVFSDSGGSTNRSLGRDIKSKIPFLTESEKAKAIAEAENVPINFWGKIVDQHNNPVPQVKVGITVIGPEIRNFVHYRARLSDLALESDTNGIFGVVNAKGKFLTVNSLEKVGYEPPPVFRRGFEYGIGQQPPGTNANQPVVFKLLNTSGLSTDDPIVYFGFKTTIACNGTPLGIDALNNNPQEGADAKGDFLITFHRDPVRLDAFSTNYSWRMNVDSPAGGLIPSEQEYTYLWKAPEDGYIPSYEWSVARRDTDWKAEKKVCFYFLTQDGKHYGRAAIDIYTHYTGEKTGIVIAGCVNSAGGRGLQKKGVDFH
jgi:hypothetical protein